jgi:dihydroxyacetone kinase
VNIPYCITDRLTAAVKGDVENGLVFTGAEAYRINKMVTVKELIKELVEKI